MEHCSDLYSEMGPKNKELLTDMETTSPPPGEEKDDKIWHKEVERAINHSKKGNSPR